MDHQLPRVGEATKAARGVDLVAMVARDALGMEFRVAPPPDYGIDGHLEVLWEGHATGRYLFTQIKAGRHYFRNADETGWTVYIRKTTVHYWQSHPVPVLLILVDLKSRACYWAHVNDDASPLEETARNYRVRVPKAHRLDSPGARAALLELDAATFVTTRRQFGHLLEAGRPFHHARPLVGRTAEVDAIVACTRERGVFAIELAGRGGIGKTRLILAAAGRVEQAGWKVRHLRDEVVLGPHAGREIPPGPVLLVVDDAHLRTDLEALFKIARRRTDPTQVLLSFRPWARSLVESAARAAGVPLSEIRRAADLRELPRDALRSLVAEELGPDLANSADMVLARTRDSTLIALAAAWFLRERRIQPQLLERSEEFRHEVLARFEDVVLGDLGERVNPEKARAVLRLVSVTGPVVPDDESWTESASSFLGFPPHEVTDVLGMLEAGEVLSRRRGRLSVSPDLLSDHLVYVALVSEAGVPTRYERQIVRHFGEGILPRLVLNLSDLEWRLEQTGAPVRVLEEVWQALFDTFRRVDNFRRLEILHQLRPVAPLQPARVYALAHWLVENPEGDNLGHAVTSDRRVLEELVPLLEQVADHEPWLERAAEILWRVVRDHPRPYHAERVASLFAYQAQKPNRVQQAALDFLHRWTREPGWADRAHSPLIVAATLLKKELGLLALPVDGSLDEANAAIAPSVTMSVRLQVVALLGKLTRGDSPRGRVAAADELLSALASPSRDRRRTDSDQAMWIVQDAAILDELESAAFAGDALVRLRVMDGLARFAVDHPGHPVAERAAALVAGISESPELSLYRAWSGLPPIWRGGGDRREQRSRDRRLAAHRTAAHALLAAHRDASQLAATLSAVNAAYTAAGLDARPAELLTAVGALEPRLGAEVALQLARAGDHATDHLGGLLYGIREAKRQVYRELLDAFAQLGTPGARRSAAAALDQAAYNDQWTAFERGHALRLACDTDAVVRHIILHAAGMGTVDPAVVLDILAHAEVGGDPILGEPFAAAAEVVLERAGDQVDEATARKLLNNLAGIRHFAEGYAVTSFLTAVATRWPSLVIGFVLSRVRLMEEAQRAEEEAAEREERPRAFFRAVPRGDWTPVWEAIRACPGGYRLSLDQVRDATVAASGETAEELAYLFGELADTDDHTAESLLAVLEGGSGADAERLLPLLEELPRGFVFAMPPAVARMMEAGYAHGRRVGAGVTLALKDSLQPRVAGRGSEHEARLRWERDQARQHAASAADGSRAREFFGFIARSADLALAAREA